MPGHDLIYFYIKNKQRIILMMLFQLYHTKRATISFTIYKALLERMCLENSLRAIFKILNINP